MKANKVEFEELKQVHNALYEAIEALYEFVDNEDEYNENYKFLGEAEGAIKRLIDEIEIVK